MKGYIKDGPAGCPETSSDANLLLHVSCVSVHLISVMLGGGVPERFINILPNSPMNLLSIWLLASIDQYTHMHKHIYTVPITFTLFTHRCTHTSCFFPLAHTHLFYLSFTHLCLLPSLFLSLFSSVSLSLCNKWQCRMDVPFICTHIMFWWKMKWSLQTD